MQTINIIEKNFYLNFKFLAFFILVYQSIFTTACSTSDKKNEEIDKALIKTAEKGDLIDEITDTGKITSWFEVKIKSKVSGEVKVVHVKEGEIVKKGQLLMELEALDYQRAVELAEIDRNEANLALKNAQIEKERTRSAYESKGISKYEYDKACQTLEITKVKLQKANSLLQVKRDQLNYAKILAPIDGVVTKRNIEPGELITAGITATVNGEPLLTIAQLDTLILEISMNQVDIGRIKTGQVATIVLDAYRDQPLKGEVWNIAAAANADTNKGIDVFKVKITLDPKQIDKEIKPGMTSEVNIHIEKYSQVLKVPSESIFEEDNKYYIYKIKNDPAKPEQYIKEKTEVTIGHRSVQEAEILSGISVGDKFYLKGESKVQSIKI